LKHPARIAIIGRDMSIRLATDDDAAAIARIYAPYVTDTAISFEAAPPPADEMAGRVRATLAYAPWIVCERDGQIVGYAYAGRHNERAAYRWSVNASVYLDRGAHRQGIGTALYRSLFALLALQGVYTVHGGITLPNAASVGLHEAMGFTLVGVYRGVGYKHGTWHDVGWWQLALRERAGEPAEPRTPAELAGSAAWDQAMASGLRAR
jgi:L-amino acid N-acyltransferase YncA